jgi:hypothetical protein
MFEANLDRMLMEKTADELPAAVLGALDDKHHEELDDLLMRLYKQRADELKGQVLALLEEKVQGQTVIAKNFKAKGAAPLTQKPDKSSTKAKKPWLQRSVRSYSSSKKITSSRRVRSREPSRSEHWQKRTSKFRLCRKPS